MHNFWLFVCALYAIFCVFAFDWRLGVAWLLVSFVVSERG